MFQTRDGYIEDILKLLCHAEKFDCKFRLFAKMSIDSEGLFGIDMRHLEIMFYMGSSNDKRPRDARAQRLPRTLITPSLTA